MGACEAGTSISSSVNSIVESDVLPSRYNSFRISANGPGHFSHWVIPEAVLWICVFEAAEETDQQIFQDSGCAFDRRRRRSITFQIHRCGCERGRVE
jgi:hypothetical protein